PVVSDGVHSQEDFNPQPVQPASMGLPLLFRNSVSDVLGNSAGPGVHRLSAARKSSPYLVKAPYGWSKRSAALCGRCVKELNQLRIKRSYPRCDNAWSECVICESPSPFYGCTRNSPLRISTGAWQIGDAA